MRNSLFEKPEGIEIGQVWIDLELDGKSEPHPMRRVLVTGFDKVGMIIVSSAFGAGVNDYHVSLKTLRRDYRMEETDG